MADELDHVISGVLDEEIIIGGGSELLNHVYRYAKEKPVPLTILFPDIKHVLVQRNFERDLAILLRCKTSDLVMTFNMKDNITTKRIEERAKMIGFPLNYVYKDNKGVVWCGWTTDERDKAYKPKTIPKGKGEGG